MCSVSIRMMRACEVTAVLARQDPKHRRVRIDAGIVQDTGGPVHSFTINHFREDNVRVGFDRGMEQHGHPCRGGAEANRPESASRLPIARCKASTVGNGNCSKAIKRRRWGAEGTGPIEPRRGQARSLVAAWCARDSTLRSVRFPAKPAWPAPEP